MFHDARGIDACFSSPIVMVMREHGSIDVLTMRKAAVHDARGIDVCF